MKRILERINSLHCWWSHVPCDKSVGSESGRQITWNLKSLGDLGCKAVLQAGPEHLGKRAKRRGGEPLRFSLQTCSKRHISEKHFTFNRLKFLGRSHFFWKYFWQLLVKSSWNSRILSTLLCCLCILCELVWPILFELLTLQILWVLFVPPCGCSATCCFYKTVLQQQPACVSFRDLWPISHLWPQSCVKVFMFLTVLPR